ncbi:DUF6332 family protein [Streptomyces sp. NBC_00249]|uniref:DUF6332 family protein n=1 Tax=Streptomyces sp. NBC_00249 TaxID=2975690 RepID=UPI00224F388D|nr:DUF6332 family protein [Streptomyces sp. NBC_00249]MCX5197147.1 DUF6332 family protein [Streptomyces sp. NBC_00249]
MGRRGSAERDAVTVEIGYAFVSACFAAALVFAAVYGAAPALGLSRAAHGFLEVAGGVLAGVVFLLRVVHVLWRFGRRGNPDARGTSG